MIKEQVKNTNRRAILCAWKCSSFVTTAFPNFVALLMYSERYWLINALSAHNPLGSVKGTVGKSFSFSHCVFSPRSWSKGIKFMGQKREYMPSDAIKRKLLLISVSSIILWNLTRICSYITAAHLHPKRIRWQSATVNKHLNLMKNSFYS